LLSDPRVDLSVNHNEFIHDAAIAGYADIVRLLLADPRVDPSARRYEAVTQSNGEIVKILLGHPKIPLKIKLKYSPYKIPEKLIYMPIKKLLREIDSYTPPSPYKTKVSLLDKYFWWIRLEYYHGVKSWTIKAMDPNADPLLLCMQLE